MPNADSAEVIRNGNRDEERYENFQHASPQRFSRLETPEHYVAYHKKYRHRRYIEDH